MTEQHSGPQPPAPPRPPAPASNPAPAHSPARYRICHRTEYQYADKVAICQNQLRMQPKTAGNVTCQNSNVTITPTPTSCDEHIDYFGNRVITFSIEAIHDALSVEATSIVDIHPISIKESSASPPWESIRITGPKIRFGTDIDQFRFRSPRITPHQRYEQYATASFTPERPILEAALDLTRRIHTDFEYNTNATTVQTTTQQAFGLRAGVCQDFAHVQIACLRSIGLAARYVSGYLRTLPPPGKERLIGADESHAWLEVYAGQDIGWIGLDPTNACLVGTDHIPVGLGRDYDDVSPMRGVVLGGGTNQLKVSVDVAPV